MSDAERWDRSQLGDGERPSENPATDSNLSQSSGEQIVGHLALTFDSSPSALATASLMAPPRRSLAIILPPGSMRKVAGMPVTPYAAGSCVCDHSPRKP